MVIDTQLLANQLKQHALECLEQLQEYRAIEENFKRAAKAYTVLTGEEIAMPDGVAPIKGVGKPMRTPGDKGRRGAAGIALDYLQAHPMATTREIHESANGECTLTALSAAMRDLKKRGIIGVRSTQGSAIVYFLRNKSADAKNETEALPTASVHTSKAPAGESQRKLLRYLTEHKDAKIGEIKAHSGVTSPESALDRMLQKKMVSRHGTRESGIMWNIAAPGRNYLAEGVAHMATAQMSNSLAH